MMFTLSAPALAESTNALMQMSINSRSSIARLNEENSIPASSLTLDLSDGSIEVFFDSDGKQYARQNENPKQQCDVLTVTSNNESTSNTLDIQGGTGTACVILKDLRIEFLNGSTKSPVSVKGNVDLYIEGVNDLTSNEGELKGAGIRKEDDGQLTIDGTGSLHVIGGGEAAGIGGNYNESGNNITINGGTITAEGGLNGSGIGGGKYAGGSNIVVNGGEVTIIGGSGGDEYAPPAVVGSLKVNGGNVTLKREILAESG